ncbi:hypothetical protein GCM10023195_83990 [Actinoallomurus liliacearum]|uniref:Secreted protein n=1 Tax=Actinoallomurus liliacearum TaxID=1080073 RepID=A0ABP8TXQ4_9ACTN
MFKKLTITAATVAAAAATTLTMAAPAHAGSTVYAENNNSCAGVWFEPDGDNFGFKDFCADGMGVYMEMTKPTGGTPSTSDSKIFKSYATSYNGSLDWYSGDVVWNQDYTEGYCFLYRVGLRKDGAYVSGTYGSWHLACA